MKSGHGRRLLTSQQAAERLGVDSSTVYRWAVQGRFPGIQYTAGGHARIPLEDIERIGGGKSNAANVALLYARVGEDDAALIGQSVAHLTRCAAERGHTIVRVVQEIGPGFDSNRPELVRIRSEISSGQPPYKVILVETLDRLLLLGASEFVQWAARVVEIIEVGACCPAAEQAYRREVVCDLYYPLTERLAMQGVPPREIRRLIGSSGDMANVQRVVSSNLANIAQALGLMQDLQGFAPSRR